MKLHYLISTLFLALFSLSVSAQDWQLFNPSYQYNYVHSARPAVVSNSIAVADTLVNGTDTVYNLNTIIAKCDTCPISLGGWNPCDTCYYVAHANHFLGYDVQQFDSIWHFSNPFNYTILPQSQVGNVWTFDSTAGVTASFVYEGFDTWFGQQDSTRIAVTSLGDSIIVTKSFGITQFPDMMGTSFQLVGIEGGTFGIDVPDFFDIYDFQVGDVFYYVEDGIVSDQGESDFYDAIEKITITTRQDGQYEVSYDVEMERYTRRDLSGGSTTTSYYLGPSGLYFATWDVHSDLIQSLPQRHVEGDQAMVSPWCGQPYQDISLHYLDSLGIYHKKLALSPEFASSAHTSLQWVQDSIYNAVSQIDVMTVDVASGLGITLERCGGGWHIWTERRLIGYIKGGVLVGDSIPAADFLVGLQQLDRSSTIKPFPNPTNDQVNMRLPFGKYEVSVFAMDGREVYRGWHEGEGYSLDVSHFPQALYTIVLAGENGRFAGRFQVLR